MASHTTGSSETGRGGNRRRAQSRSPLVEQRRGRRRGAFTVSELGRHAFETMTTVGEPMQFNVLWNHSAMKPMHKQHEPSELRKELRRMQTAGLVRASGKGLAARWRVVPGARLPGNGIAPSPIEANRHANKPGTAVLVVSRDPAAPAAALDVAPIHTAANVFDVELEGRMTWTFPNGLRIRFRGGK